MNLTNNRPIVFTNLVTDERTNGRTSGQVENIMPPPARYKVLHLSICSSVRSFVHYRVCKHDILQMNEPALL